VRRRRERRHPRGRNGALDPATGAVAGGQTVQTIPGTFQLNGVSCVSATDCLAVGYDGSFGPGQAVAIDPATGAIAAGQSVEDVTGTFELMGVACPQTSLCVGVGDTSSGGGAAVALEAETGAAPSGQSVEVLAGAGVLSAVACPSAALCLGPGPTALPRVPWSMSGSPPPLWRARPSLRSHRAPERPPVVRR
jgi:hypothetical protein